MGPLEGELVNASAVVELKEGVTLKELLKKADAALGFKKQKPFKGAFRQGERSVILLNGDRFDLPEDGSHLLSEGDEVSVILFVAGG